MRTVWIADDGKEFDNEHDCLAHENFERNTTPKIEAWLETIAKGKRQTEYVRIITQWEAVRDEVLAPERPDRQLEAV